MYLNVFGPSDKYQGPLGLKGKVGRYFFTLHFFPRFNWKAWGYRKSEWVNSFDAGPLLALCWSMGEDDGKSIF